jgi:transposase-like protein
VRQFQARFAKAIEIFEAGIDDVLSYLHYPQPHRLRISSTNPLERLNLKIRRAALAWWASFPIPPRARQVVQFNVGSGGDERLL